MQAALNFGTFAIATSVAAIVYQLTSDGILTVAVSVSIWSALIVGIIMFYDLLTAIGKRQK